MKKISILFLALVASTVSLFAAQKVLIDDLYFLLDDNLNQATVTYYTTNTQHNYEHVTTAIIPEAVTYNNKTYSVVAIGDSAFHHSSVMECLMPQSVRSIGYYAFFGAANLFDVDGPGVTSIANKAFVDCTSFNFFMFPQLITIGNLAFNNCTALIDVELEDQVTTINQEAFRGCTGLKTLSLGTHVNTIDKWAFRGCTALEAINSHNTTPPALGEDVFMDVNKSNVTVTVPAGSASAYKAAAGWADFKNKTFEATAKIGDLYYYLYPDGTAEVIKDQDINHSYLSPYPDITALNVPASVSHEDNTYVVTKIGSQAFKWCQNLTTVTLPSTIEKIAEDAFFQSSITAITIPNSVRTIGSSAFGGCANLASANLPSDLITINYGLFLGCSKLTSINIPEYVKTIGGSAFNSCGLTSIDLPASLVQIGSAAFGFCDKLTSVTCRALVPPAAEGAFAGVETENIPLYIHAFYVNDYKAAAEWEKFTNVLPIPETQGVENVQNDKVQSTKVLRNGQLFIEKNGKTFNAQGAEMR